MSFRFRPVGFGLLTLELLTDVENARVWGGLRYRTTMTESAKHFPQIARDIGRRHFLADTRDHDVDDQ